MKNFNLSDIVSVKDETVLVDVVKEVEPVSTSESLDVEKFNVNPIHIEKIYDKHGRLSDMIEAATKVTGLSVIPLSAVGISSDVVFMQRYGLSTYNGITYAMSREIREDVIGDYVMRISEAISEGIVFTEDLSDTFTYRDEVFPTYRLSLTEIGVLMSKFSQYKHKAFVKDSSHICIQIYPERLKDE